MTHIASSARSSADARGCVTKGRCELSISRSRQPADVRASAAWRSKPGWGHLVRTKVRGIFAASGLAHRTASLKWAKGVGRSRGRTHCTSPASVICQSSGRILSHGGGAKRGQQPALSLLLHEGVEGRPAVRRDEVEQALAVLRHEGIEIDELGDPLRHLLGNARDHHAARAVADEDHAIEVLVLQDVDDVLDMGGQGNLRPGEVGAFAEAGQGGGVDRVALLAETRGHLVPAPTAEPCRMNQHERSLGARLRPRLGSARQGRSRQQRRRPRPRRSHAVATDLSQGMTPWRPPGIVDDAGQSALPGGGGKSSF